MLDARLLAMATNGTLERGVFLEVVAALCDPGLRRTNLDGTYFVLEQMLESSPEMSARDRIDLCVAVEFRRLSPKVCHTPNPVHSLGHAYPSLTAKPLSRSPWEVLERAANNQYIPARCIAQGAAGALTELEARVEAQHREHDQA